MKRMGEVSGGSGQTPILGMAMRERERMDGEKAFATMLPAKRYFCQQVNLKFEQNRRLYLTLTVCMPTFPPAPTRTRSLYDLLPLL